jgi:hypothetical protein
MEQACRATRSFAAVVVGCVLALNGGCARSVVKEPLLTNTPPDDVTARLDFWDAMSDHGVVSNDEGLHGLFLLADSRDPSASYAERVSRAKERGWLADGFDEAADLSMQRGTAARAVCGLCDIEGGLMMHLLGPTGRYATRELIFMGMMAPGTEQQSLSGREFIGIITKAQDYMALQRLAEENKKKESS